MQYNDLMEHLDPEDLLDDVWEEEEEEELEEEDEDRGDDVDPDLQDEEEAVDESDDDSEEEEIDPDDLKDLAGEGGNSGFIPKGRFDEVNNRAKEALEAARVEREARLRLEEELARERGSRKPEGEPEPKEAEPEFDLKAARKAMREALYEGNDELYEQLQEQVDAAQEAKLARLAEERAEARYQQRMQAEIERQEQAEIARINDAAAKAAETYDWLDADSADYDKRAVARAIAYRNLYIDEGVDKAEAILRAAEDVNAEINGGQASAGERKTTLTTSQIEKNLKREKQIPPRAAGIGERSQKIDFTKLTEDEFDSLPEAEKKKARGDYVG